MTILLAMTTIEWFVLGAITGTLSTLALFLLMSKSDSDSNNKKQ
jgi:hypothetical protein